MIELEETCVNYSVTEVGKCDSWNQIPCFGYALTPDQQDELKTTGMVTIVTNDRVTSISAVEMKVQNGTK